MNFRASYEYFVLVKAIVDTIKDDKNNVEDLNEKPSASTLNSDGEEAITRDLLTDEQKEDLDNVPTALWVSKRT